MRDAETVVVVVVVMVAAGGDERVPKRVTANCTVAGVAVV